MRRIHREPLSEEAMARLCERTLRIGDAGNMHSTPGARARARKKEAKQLWDNERTKAFNEIDRVLKRMAPGNGYCMYCEHNHGSTIDHFWPKAKYPGRAYDWHNYLLSCSICNGDFKQEQFPRDDHGNPLLLNPAEDNPYEHLEFTPRTGKYVGRTLKGQTTIEALGFKRRGELDKTRHDAWRVVQMCIVAYARACERGNTVAALYAQRTLCRHPHASTLSRLLEMLDDPSAASGSTVDADCLAAISAYPQIRSWV